jgi:hypothetical protein
MNERNTFNRLQPAKKQKRQADIVFCMDATNSMASCFSGVKGAVGAFVTSLQSRAEVDYRLRLFAYRDRHDQRVAHIPWAVFPFTASADEFIRQLDGIQTEWGGDERESTLDALYQCIHSDWREHQTHRTIVLITNSDTHPTLLPSTYNRPDNGIERVLQDLREMKHSILYIIAPRCPAYERLERSMESADRKRIAKYLQGDMDEAMANIPWEALLTFLGELVSNSSLNMDGEAGA